VNMTEDDVVNLIRRNIQRAGSLRALAREWKITPSYLSDLTNGRRAPGPAVLVPLGLEEIRIITYRKRDAKAERTQAEARARANASRRLHRNGIPKA
jgi:hypothetical protein